MNKYTKYIISFGILFIAVILISIKYYDYIKNPWTRNGQVRANVVQLTSRISGPIIKINVTNNQFVKAGDLLFEIDPRTYKAQLDQVTAQLEATTDNVKALAGQAEAARANVDSSLATIEEAKTTILESQSTLEKNKIEYTRQNKLILTNVTSQENLDIAKNNLELAQQKVQGAKASLIRNQANLHVAKANLTKTEAQLGAIGKDNAQIKSALASVKTAELNYEFTKVYAPVDGYITNLDLRIGSQIVANQPTLALIDSNSFWITGFFKENTIQNIHKGNKAVVTLMSYPNTPLEGKVTSIGWGISQTDGSTGFQLLPTVQASFEWVRLAQRIPVIIHLSHIPDNVSLRVGTTASVLIMTKTQSSTITAVPPILN